MPKKAKMTKGKKASRQKPRRHTGQKDKKGKRRKRQKCIKGPKKGKKKKQPKRPAGQKSKANRPLWIWYVVITYIWCHASPLISLRWLIVFDWFTNSRWIWRLLLLLIWRKVAGRENVGYAGKQLLLNWRKVACQEKSAVLGSNWCGMQIGEETCLSNMYHILSIPSRYIFSTS